MGQSVGGGSEVQQRAVATINGSVLAVVVDVEVVTKRGRLENLEPAIDQVGDVEVVGTGLLHHDRHVNLLGLWDQYNRMVGSCQRQIYYKFVIRSASEPDDSVTDADLGSPATTTAEPAKGLLHGLVLGLEAPDEGQLAVLVCRKSHCISPFDVPIITGWPWVVHRRFVNFT